MMNIAEIIVNQFLELDPKDFPSNKILENNNQNEKSKTIKTYKKYNRTLLDD